MAEVDEDVENVVAVVKLDGRTRWYRGPRELFILDYVKWRDSFLSAGHMLPDLDESDRGGLHVVSVANSHQFLELIKSYEVASDDLAFELATRFGSAKSWWDVSDLFPVTFINFDESRVSAFYPNGTPMEKFLPSGWTGIFKDFATEHGEGALADGDKFWIKGGSDLLGLLNERVAGLR